MSSGRNVPDKPCTPKDLKEVFQIADKYTSFDAIPTLADLEGLDASNPKFFSVAEDDLGKITGFVTGWCPKLCKN